MRLVVIPSSPPKKLRRISALEPTSSPSPSEIIAKAVPALRVDTAPKITPKAKPDRPPTSGTSGSGTGSTSRMMVFMAWTTRNAPSP